MSHSLVVSLVLTLVLVSGAWAERPATVPDGADGRWPDYRIGAEDALQIVVWKSEPLTRAVTVRPDGMISLPLINDVRAAGLTPMELRATLTDLLKDHVSEPEVAVLVTEVRSFKVSVIGEVTKPARYELRSATTVLDVLAMAGGLTSQAVRSAIVVLRREGSVVKEIPFDYSKVTSEGKGAMNVLLRPGDIVVVP